MFTTTLILLAKSWRPGGLCIAGRKFESNRIGEWVRPVVSYNDDAFPVDYATYLNGQQMRLLDIVQLDLSHQKPSDHQSENWELHRNPRIRRIGRFDRNRLRAICDGGESLWTNGQQSQIGLNNRVRYVEATGMSDSLRLIHVDRLRLTVIDDEDRERNRLTGTFDYMGATYTLQVKDVEFEDQSLERKPGNYFVNNRYITISLAGEFERYCYKLIAGII